MHRLLITPALAAATLAALAGPAPAAPAADTQSLDVAGYTAQGAANSVKTVDAHWTVPAITCGAQDRGLLDTGIGIGSGTAHTAGVQLYSASSCIPGNGGTGPAQPDYSAGSDIDVNPQFFDNEVDPGDAMHGTVASDGAGNYTFTLVDQTRNWTATAKGSSTKTTASSVQVGMQKVSAKSRPVFAFDKATFTGATMNGKPLADAKPTRNVLVGSAGKVEVKPTDLDAKGGFTCTVAA